MQLASRVVLVHSPRERFSRPSRHDALLIPFCYLLAKSKCLYSTTIFLPRMTCGLFAGVGVAGRILPQVHSHKSTSAPQLPYLGLSNQKSIE